MRDIIAQYDKIKNPTITRVIMDGGGNDVLASGSICKNELKDGCKKIINDAIEQLDYMMVNMQGDGIEEFIFMGVHYPRKWNSGYDNAVNYAWDYLKDFCYWRKYKCTLVDPRSLFLNESLLDWDGIHPNWQGAGALAEMLRDSI